MLKQVFRREMFLRNLLSFLGLALAAIVLISLVATQNLERSRKAQYENGLSERMQLALEDIQRQFEQAQKIALHVGATYECNRRIFSQHKFYELEMLKEIENFDGKLGFQADYFLLYFAQSDVLYHMKAQGTSSSTFSRVYFDKELGETNPNALLEELGRLTNASFLRIRRETGEPLLLLVAPFQSIGNYSDRAVIAWVLEEKQIMQRLRLVTGGIGDSFALYWQGICLVRENMFDGENTSYATKENGEFALLVDRRMDSLYAISSGVDNINRLMYFLSFIVLIILAFALTIYTYRPIRRLTMKYRRMDKDEIGGLEKMIEEAYGQLRTMDVDYGKRLNAQREHVLLLILNGICSERVIASFPIFADGLRGPWYAVITVQTENSVENTGHQLEELSDGLVSVYVCSWQAGLLHILLSMREADALENIANILKDLLEENGGKYKIGVSDICQEIAMVSSALKEAGQRLEDAERTAYSDYSENHEVDEAPAMSDMSRLETGGDDVRMRSILEYIDRHVFEWELTMGNTAAEFQLSTAYFSNLFKQANGENFHRYVTALRIREAKRLLAETALPIAQIGESVGYINLSHFIKVFREEEECTPGIYRQRHKHEKSE